MISRDPSSQVAWLPRVSVDRRHGSVLFTSRLGSRRFARMIALKPSLLRKNNRRSCPKLRIVLVRLSICQRAYHAVLISRWIGDWS